MFRRSMLAAAISGCVATSSFGGFVVSYAATYVDATFYRLDIYARNTGGDTGTGLLAFELSSDAYSGEAVWRSTSAGNWSPTNPADIANRSRVRIDMEDVSSTSLVSKTPAANQPLAAAYGPLTVALGNFGVVVAGLNGAVPAETGSGALFASLFVTNDYLATLSGNVGGSAGAKVPFSLIFGIHGDYIIGIRSITPNPVPVVFGPVVTSGAGFSTTVQVDGVPANANVFLRMGELPTGVHDVSITGGGTQSRTFTVSGIVDYSLNLRDIVLPFTANCPGIYGPTDYGTITLRVTPEPGMLSLLAASVFVRRRR